MKNAYFIFILVLIGGLQACRKKLDVGNPNNPTIAGNVNSERGIIALAQGGVYINGLSGYFNLPWVYQELLADNIGADMANNQVSTIGVPDYIIVNGFRVSNPSPSIGILRTYNNRASTAAGNNAFFFQWSMMYSMNNACNTVLEQVDKIPFSGDAATKINTIRAWSYWWKGFAYASIGSTYFSGLINDKTGTSSSHYVTHEVMIDQSNKYFNLAATTLNSISNMADYGKILSQLIPAFCQVGLGGDIASGAVLTPDMWKRNINTMLARNILVNKLSPFVNGNPAATITRSSTSVMTASDWNSVLGYATNGIRPGDFIFTGRSPAINPFFSAFDGSVSSLTLNPNNASAFKISERFIQNFKTGDQRLVNNFDQLTTYNNSFVYSTRFSMIDGGNGLPGVYVYGTQTPDNYELIIAGSYEENALMLAEANIRTGNINTGLGFINAVRNYLGSGLPVFTGLNLDQAMKELVQERRVALVFRGLSFYDSRRWGWTYDINYGGGSYGNTLLDPMGNPRTNVFFNYNFLDYWDIPEDETILNPPSPGSAPVKNPNF